MSAPHAAVFDRLHAGYAGFLEREALRLTRNRDDAQDLLADLWGRAWSARESLRSVDAAGTWLIRILHRLHVDRLRLARRRLATVSLDEALDPDGQPLVDLIPDPGETPESALLVGERHQALYALLARLKPDHREVLELHDLWGLEYDELPGCPTPAAGRKRRERALRAAQQLATRPDSGLEIFRSAA